MSEDMAVIDKDIAVVGLAVGRGVSFVDAPVSGGRTGAVAGRLAAFVGAESDALDGEALAVAKAYGVDPADSAASISGALGASRVSAASERWREALAAWGRPRSSPRQPVPSHRPSRVKERRTMNSTTTFSIASATSGAATARAALDAHFPQGLGSFVDRRVVPGRGEAAKVAEVFGPVVGADTFFTEAEAVWAPARAAGSPFPSLSY
ncbi:MULTISPECIES: NAD(P)-binding domain-containing protein [unclassified Streptomyces]|uniref:NAD(P)-binding domain-containing protein n=1 Tax=unclassified Streptomyces TaxID=2593676 RepID=UPI00278C8326|nr:MULTISPECIES: NAD(P)-binding domain-containing protein [unclassified Streptomyces]